MNLLKRPETRLEYVKTARSLAGSCRSEVEFLSPFDTDATSFETKANSLRCPHKDLRKFSRLSFIRIEVLETFVGEKIAEKICNILLALCKLLLKSIFYFLLFHLKCSTWHLSWTIIFYDRYWQNWTILSEVLFNFLFKDFKTYLHGKSFFAELHIDCCKVKIDENNGWTNGGILLTINLQFQNKLSAARCKNSRFIILDDLSLVRSQCLLTRSSDLWFLPRFSDEITHASMKGFIIDNTRFHHIHTYIGIVVFCPYIVFFQFSLICLFSFIQLGYH